MRQRFEASHGLDANDRRIGRQRSVGDRAQRRAAVTALQFLELCGAALKLNKSRTPPSTEIAVDMRTPPR